MDLPANPFDPQRAIGTVISVSASTARCNLPRAAAPASRWHHGVKLGTGEVGDFVFVQCDETAVFGRIISVRLPERERLSVEPELGVARATHPVGEIQLLTTVRLASSLVEGGISTHPRLGAEVYSAHPMLVKWLAENQRSKIDAETPSVSLDLAHLPADAGVSVTFTPERLFGRHCAVLGATGGGKSWTLSRLISEAGRFNSKIILLDGTGEFHTLGSRVVHCHIGEDPTAPSTSEEITFPYSHLKESDLFALFSPSGQTQAPKLRAAMKSLKLARVAGPPLADGGLIRKAGRRKREVEEAEAANARALAEPLANFEIARLTRQIDEECVWQSGRGNDYSVWGNPNEMERSYCVTLITRIEDMLQSPELTSLFHPGTRRSFQEKLDAFLGSDDAVLRVSLKTLAFAHNTREIVGNAIGRCLLDRARDGQFRDRPIVVFLDEAHQFLNKSLGDEFSRFPLDSFELIAKEGRKFGLTVCLSTQRPRDIPEGVLSQIGTLLVHRLINDRDREVVERASGEIDRSASSFLPTLGPGEAVVIGVDFPIPLTIQVWVPTDAPDSRGPDYQRHWARAEEGDEVPPSIEDLM